MILRMNTTVPLPSGLSVAELIEILEMVPDKNARVRGAHSAGGYGGTDAYRLELSWTKEVVKDEQ